jgi:hypothetical protein
MIRRIILALALALCLSPFGALAQGLTAAQQHRSVR